MSTEPLEFWRPFLICTAAGLSTTIGAAMVFFIDPKDEKKFSTFLALSAGVMLYLCFVEMIPEAQTAYTKHYKEQYDERFKRDSSIGEFDKDATKRLVENMVSLWFFASALLCFIADKTSEWYIHRKEAREAAAAKDMGGHAEMDQDMNIDSFNTDTDITPQKYKSKEHREKSLMTMALISAVAITIHNIPEGVSTFLSNSSKNNFGIPMAIAIGLHNIPEGIAVGLPILRATGSKWTAFILATLSGVAQPLAALVAYFILQKGISDIVEACMFSSIAGMMVYIAIIKLYPCAMEYNVDLAGKCFLLGMLSMGASLALFKTLERSL